MQLQEALMRPVWWLAPVWDNETHQKQPNGYNCNGRLFPVLFPVQFSLVSCLLALGDDPWAMLDLKHRLASRDTLNQPCCNRLSQECTVGTVVFNCSL